MDGKYLFGSEVLFHNGKMITQTDVQEWSILTSYENLQPGRFSRFQGEGWGRDLFMRRVFSSSRFLA